MYALALLFCSYVAAFIDRGLVSVAAAPIKHDLHLSDAQLGLLNGMAFVALYCVCGIPLGWLADRSDRRAIIAIGLLFWSAMTAACAIADSLGGFFLARAGVGLGEACLIPAGISLLGSVTPQRHLGRSIAVFLMGATVGNSIALLGGGWLLHHIGAAAQEVPGIGRVAPWRGLFLLAAVPGIVLAVLVARIREPVRISPVVSPWSALTTAASLLYANRSAYVPVTISTACVIVLSQTQAAWVPLFYARAFHLEPGEAAMIVGLIFLVTAPAGQWLGGLLIDHLRTRGIAAAPHFVQAACAMACIPAAAIFCTSTHIGASEAAYTVFNLLVFAATPSGLTAWQLLTPQRSQGLVVALLVAFVTLVGVGAGPVVVGTLTDRIFVDEAGLGASLLSVIVIAGVAGCLAALYGRRAFNRSVTVTRPAADLV